MSQENNLGSIQPGKLADPVGLDRNYLTCRRIKDIKPVLTWWEGKIVFDAAAVTSTRTYPGFQQLTLATASVTQS